jgi:subtilisin family serine protease
MKIKTNKDVHIRTTTSAADASNIKGIIHSGFEIEIAEMVDGQSIQGNSAWYKDLNGDYYWSGDFEEQQIMDARDDGLRFTFPEFLKSIFDPATKRITGKVDYFNLLDIKEDYKTAVQKDVHVTIIDNPINTNIPGLSRSFIRPSYYPKIYADHGSFIAGLIGSNDPEGIVGVAPKSKLIELPIFNVFGQPDFKNFLDRLAVVENEMEQMVVVINASIHIKKDERVIAALRKLSRKFIVVAAAGEDEQLESELEHQFPAADANSISVGKVTARYLKKGSFQNIRDDIDFLVPEFKFISYGESETGFEYNESTGDSYSCAIVTGVIAHLLASGKCEYNLQSVKDTLTNVCYPIQDSENFSHLRIINPKAL